MEFFYVTEDLDFKLKLGDSVYERKFKKPIDKPSLSSIYVSTGACLLNFRQLDKDHSNSYVRLGDQVNRDQIFSLKKFPKIINEYYYSKSINEFNFSHDHHITNGLPNYNFKIEKHSKVLIINGMGTGIGDGIVGIRALQLFEEKHHVDITLASVSIVADQFHKDLYASNNFKQIFLPVTLGELCEYDYVVDFSALAIQSGFNELNFLDFYLKSLNIDPSKIPNFKKANHLTTVMPLDPNIKTIIDDLKDRGKKIVGFKPTASTPIRSLDDNRIADHLIELLKHDPKIHVLMFDVPHDFANRNKLGPAFQKRFHNVNRLEYNQLVNVIKELDYMITVDTCFYHITNAFNVPTLALFTTIDPALRVGYYDNVKAVNICPNTKLKGKHMSHLQSDYKYHLEQIKLFKLKPHFNLIKGL